MKRTSPQVRACYNYAYALDKLRLPYVFGGGHPGFGPSGGGYDCSGWASAILRAGGILESSVALDTEGLENWGLSGQGEHLTLWVINNSNENHCFLDFRIPLKRHRWSEAGHTGSICGWRNVMITTGFTPRRPNL